MSKEKPYWNASMLQMEIDKTTLSSRILRACENPISQMTKSWMKEIEYTSKLLKAVIPLAVTELEEKKAVYYDH